MKTPVLGLVIILTGLLVGCATISTSPDVQVTPSGSDTKWIINAKSSYSFDFHETVFLYVNGTQVTTGVVSLSPTVLSGTFQGHAIQASCRALGSVEMGVTGTTCIMYVDQVQEATLMF